MDWKNKVIYQIYPRSFLDSSGSGTGDLNGIKKLLEVDYIKMIIGVDYVWFISPLFFEKNLLKIGCLFLDMMFQIIERLINYLAIMMTLKIL